MERGDIKKGGVSVTAPAEPPPSSTPPLPLVPTASPTPCIALRRPALEAPLALRWVRPWWSPSWCEQTGHTGATERDGGDSRSFLFFTSSLRHTHRLGYICAPLPLRRCQGRGQWPCHLTQGKGCICWEGGRRGGGRWAGWAADGGALRPPLVVRSVYACGGM